MSVIRGLSGRNNRQTLITGCDPKPTFLGWLIIPHSYSAAPCPAFLWPQLVAALRKYERMKARTADVRLVTDRFSSTIEQISWLDLFSRWQISSSASQVSSSIRRLVRRPLIVTFLLTSELVFFILRLPKPSYNRRSQAPLNNGSLQGLVRTWIGQNPICQI